MADENAKWYNHFGRQFGDFFKLNKLLPYSSAMTLLGIYPHELKTYDLMKTCTEMFIAALFIIAKTWKQPGYPLVGEWINKLWYIQTT